MKIIDSHSHLHSAKDFPDYLEVLQRARTANVYKQIIIGCDLSDSQAALEMAQKYDDLEYTIGVHPHEAKDLDSESLDRLENMLKLTDRSEGKFKRAVGIGEIGLDYFKNLSGKQEQQDAFKRQLDLARRWDLPVVLHVREAFEDTFKILDEFQPSRAVFHCFAGGVDEMLWARQRNYLLSFAGIVTYPKAAALHAAARQVDAAGYLVETDCPYLSPQVFRGQRNEPAFVVETAKYIADLRGEDLTRVAFDTTTNALQLFGLNS